MSEPYTHLYTNIAIPVSYLKNCIDFVTNDGNRYNIDLIRYPPYLSTVPNRLTQVLVISPIFESPEKNLRINDS